MVYFDKKNNRLVMVENRADSDYWDSHWETSQLENKIKEGLRNRIVKKNTKRFLPSGGRIIEGGCGIGQLVYALGEWGYDAYGVDYAEKTIKKTKELMPELKIEIQDVKKMGFADSFFDGYWSLGVIEHFYDGFDDIISEAARVVKPGGYLFLTFPHMSLLRKIKIKFGGYRALPDIFEKESFYQFMLDGRSVQTKVEKHGFELVMRQNYGAIKGIKDEVPALKVFLQKVHDGNDLVSKIIRRLIALLFDRSAGHITLLVFKRK
ncbi:class I SAM-dependent methyltransferase [Candidatus Falkowbacteria bacterium]|nr:class I SAM-dependent methyltransferase [Candidatus Falkowbacteria bacterium]